MSESSTFTRLKAEVSKDDTVLDIGTKDGTTLTEVSGTRIGVDITADGFRADPSILFVLADGHQLPLKTNSVDYVFCTQVLEHLPEHGHVIREAGRVLKPDGTAYFSFPNRLSLRQPHSLVPRYYSVLPRRLGLLLAPRLLDDHSREYYERAIYPLSPLSVRWHLHRRFSEVTYPMRLSPETVTAVPLLQTLLWWLNTLAMVPPLRWAGELGWPATTYVCRHPRESSNQRN